VAFDWRMSGRQKVPPPVIKRAFLRRCARRGGLRVFVETGTFEGGTLEALRGSFDELHSIELSQTLYERAVAKFRDDPKIRIWLGDSGEIIPHVLEKISDPALFWLDGHFSGGNTARGVEDTPIRSELAHIAGHFLKDRHVVVIDDARLFNGTDGYPTLDDLSCFAAKLGFGLWQVEDDMIVLTAKRNPISGQDCRKRETN
jgi:hypothetical protein